MYYSPESTIGRLEKKINGLRRDLKRTKEGTLAHRKLEIRLASLERKLLLRKAELHRIEPLCFRGE